MEVYERERGRSATAARARTSGSFLEWLTAPLRQLAGVPVSIAFTYVVERELVAREREVEPGFNPLLWW